MRRWFDIRFARLLLSALLLGAAALPAVAEPVPFAPLLPGVFGAGQGADASFHKIDNAWRGSTVLWDEENKKFGSGVPIGSFEWGTGLWGRADWNAVLAAAAGQGGPTIEAAWQGLSAQINYANQRYNDCFSATWGPAPLVPIPQSNLNPAVPCNDPAGDGAHPTQQNWISHFSGYIRITDADEYNFSVLNDDGFFLRLIGAEGAEIAIERDFLNARDRNGLDQSLALSPGLYGFELGTWNRLGAGVVDLRWLQGANDRTWDLVPVSHLVAAVPAPAPWTLAALAMTGLMVVRRRRERRADLHR